MESEGERNTVRAIFTAGFVGVMNAVIMFLPVDQDVRTQLAVTLNPTVTLVAFVAWRAWDHWDDRQ